MSNIIKLDAKIKEVAPLRYSPSGVAVLELILHHQSWQQELGNERKATFEIAAKIFGNQAQEWQDKVGKDVSVEGFLNSKSIKYPKIILHIEKIELSKG